MRRRWPRCWALWRYLFAAYGIKLPVDLNGPQFIAEDYLAEPLPVREQVAYVPSGAGLGLVVDESKVQRFLLPSSD